MPNLCLEKGYLQMNSFLDLEGNISTIILDVKQNLSPSGLYWLFNYLKRCKKNLGFLAQRKWRNCERRKKPHFYDRPH